MKCREEVGTEGMFGRYGGGDWQGMENGGYCDEEEEQEAKKRSERRWVGGKILGCVPGGTAPIDMRKIPLEP